ncbi:hypothetical protein OHS33_26625 [Streptomyces sp. NBC_00536]|uniref:hypothetical protein n=1 Tax=Streptomyces sp. NBC_00536 TaxID=2975769 RepID=UPI002E804B52|nr:hypothetical protein [Streptomyces sp. NBC_00536]WUC81597.1 hypothetical protein OHS33_26625 [Streptomyces sp. NBC_00536]
MTTEDVAVPWTMPSRRSLLAGAAGAAGAALLTGCSGGAVGADSAEAPPERPIREGAVRDSELLLERYDATIAAHPPLAERLAPLRSAVAAHMGALAPDDSPPKPSPSPSGSPSGAAADGRTGAAGNPPGKVPGKNADPVPAQPAEALTALATAERDLAEARTIALAGTSGELARLLASVAACGAVHTYLLSSNPGGKA